MSILTSAGNTTWMIVLGVVLTVVAAVVAWLTAQFASFRRWLVYALILALAIFLVYFCLVFLPPRHLNAGSGLPLFGDHIWGWLLVFLLSALGVMVYLADWLFATVRQRRAEAAGLVKGQFPDMDVAWDEIQVRLRQAQIALARQKVYLLIAPDEGWSAALIRSAGLNVFALAPETVAPIHAYATSDGVLLTCSGATALGRQDSEGLDRLEYLGKLLLSQNPECPIVRGIAVLFPADWAAQSDAPKQAALVRDDLMTLQRVLKVRCPVYALFPQMENTPGFPEFVSRMPDAMRQNRCGFAVPGTKGFSGQIVQDGMVWLSGWFHTWILSQMAEDLLNHEGNTRLFLLDDDMRRYRRPWRNVLESALSTHSQGDPILFRGCYCVGTGGAVEEQAFSAGLLRGPRSRILADHSATVWSTRAEVEDRQYRKYAWTVAAVGGGLCLGVWAYLISLIGGLGWVGILTLIAIWVVAILGRSLRS